jgi:hypothetical protein
MIFVAMLGFYIMLLCFKVNTWLAIAGAFAYGLSTYFLIIAGAGHNTKMRAMAYMPLIIGGIHLAYSQKKMWLGMLVVCLALGLQIRANHLQITYYTAMVVLIFIIFESVRIYKEKQYAHFFKTSASMIVALALAIGVNITNILLTAEYTPYSTRGKSELTDDSGNKTSGLDKTYILDDYSYGIVETMNLFIPNFVGGSSGAKVGDQSPIYEALIKNGGMSKREALEVCTSVPTYWGGQRFTSGPVYIGAVVIFLFIIGLFLVKGQIKWWLVSSLLLCLMLAWGKNFMILSELFIDFFPGYNKFRTVSMILVIAQLVIPLLGILALKALFDNEIAIEEKKQAIKKGFYVAGGIALFFSVFPGLFFDFSAEVDQMYLQHGYPAWFIDALQDTRQYLLRTDAMRTLFFVTAAAAALWFATIGKLKISIATAIITLLIITDLWTVDKRYLNESNFASKGVNNIPSPSAIDLEILQDKDISYRVFNRQNPFNEATTSFFHKSIGGYHGAKMKRYQELIERHIGNMNMDVLNMLNTKYIIAADRTTNRPFVQANPQALGNAWTVPQIRWVEDADEEIQALADFDPKEEVIIDKRFKSVLKDFVPTNDTIANVQLLEYQPNRLVYEYYSNYPQLVVFSEIFYSKGWAAYINGQSAEHVRANYVLRAMEVPAGKQEIVFEFKPKTYKRGERIALSSSVMIVLLIIGVTAYQLKRLKMDR